MLNDIFMMYRNGEIIPYVLLAIVAVGYIIIFEKFIVLQFVYRINFEKYNTQMKKMLTANDMERARNFSRATSRTTVPMLAIKAIDAYETDPMRVRSAVSEESLRFFPRIRRRINQLPNLAATCVLLGAIAAVQGIWGSFHMVEGLELGIKSFAFSSGLSHALLPLTISLVSAVVLMLPFGILDAIAWRLEAEMEHSLCVILNILSPEMQPMFAGGGGSSNNNNSNDDSQGGGYSPSSGGMDADDDMDDKPRRAGNEGGASSLQEVPDEEEII
ncbi:MotA/TolQ/ExbB proton channel family protein [Fluviispira vulneris]|uniref:MotA/TolQ/ExbB proton channel family protein n=1 Tax=Fluviispira vulneris TaxID=2763012 RepID=UPI0016492930|nr:MotA/TolQ/ExbB proton channel family protein [Fluviispira vulneris]